MDVPIDRAFVRIDTGLLHLRSAGAGDAHLPIYLAHSGPGSSLGLVDMIRHLAASRRVLAPDLLGLGDSEPHALARPSIADYADDVARLLDAVAVERIDFYGQHTGALVGCEFALRHPHRVRRLALDGIALFDEALRADMQLHYAPVMQPDVHGCHLQWAWAFVRELSLHFPHFRTDPAHRLHDNPVPPPAALHRLVVDLLKALPTYHLSYQAAFDYRAEERLPLVVHEALLMGANGDPLARYLAAAAAALPVARTVLTTRDDRARTLEAFLDAASTAS